MVLRIGSKNALGNKILCQSRSIGDDKLPCISFLRLGDVMGTVVQAREVKKLNLLQNRLLRIIVAGSCFTFSVQLRRELEIQSFSIYAMMMVTIAIETLGRRNL